MMTPLFVAATGAWSILWLCLLASMSQRRRLGRCLTLFDSLEEYR